MLPTAAEAIRYSKIERENGDDIEIVLVSLSLSYLHNDILFFRVSCCFFSSVVN